MPNEFNSNQNKGSWLPESIEDAIINDGLEIAHVWIVSKSISYHLNGSKFYASNAYLGKKLGKVPRTIQRLIESLVDRGWIEKEMKKSHRGSERAIIPSEKSLSVMRGDIDVMGRGDIDVMPGVTQMTPNNIEYNKELIIKNNIDKNTGIFGAELFHIDELDSKEFRQCHIAMEIIKDYKSSGTKVYD